MLTGYTVFFLNALRRQYWKRIITEPREYSERTAQVIDDEVARLVADMEDRAVGLLTKHRKQLNRLAEALLAEETLDREGVSAAVDVRGPNGWPPDN